MEIEVEDDGDGIAVEDRDRVFDVFYGADRIASIARSGLGLAIARATVEAHAAASGWPTPGVEPACDFRCPSPRSGVWLAATATPGERTSNESISSPSDALKPKA